MEEGKWTGAAWKSTAPLAGRHLSFRSWQAGADDVKKHKWFTNLQWDALYKREVCGDDHVGSGLRC